MSEHTPGPWVFECEDVGSYGSTFWLDSENGEEIISQSEDPYEGVLIKGGDFIANARLIAAAPDLLEALQDMYEWHEIQEDPEWHGSPLEQRSSKAIAKAKGETE